MNNILSKDNGKDYHLTLTIRNAPLLRAMKDFGYKSAADLSRDCLVAQSVIGDMLALKMTVFTKNGYVRKPVIKVAEFLSYHPTDLFPESHWYDSLLENKFEVEVNRNELGSIKQELTADPSTLIDQIDLGNTDIFQRIIDSCPNLIPREASILRDRFMNNMTLDEIGVKNGVNKERIRQLEGRALRRLRNPDCQERGLGDILETFKGAIH